MAKKILIADDDTTIRDLIRKTLELEEARFEIYEAQSGNIALEMARIIKPQLILLDVMMPGMSGYEVCRNLKDSPETKDFCVVFLTGRRSEMSRQTIESCGGDDFMTKPFNLNVLMHKVKKFLGPV